MARARTLCSCGRRLVDASARIAHFAERYVTYHLCQCGVEWTTTEIGDHVARDPVTSGEVLAVHERLQQFEGTITEMLELLQA